MGQVLHGTATTTHTTRAKIQSSKASLRELAEHYSINPKTARKWKSRDFVEDLKCGSKPGQGSVLTEIDQAVIIEARRQTLLPLDDCLYVAFDSGINPLQSAPLPTAPPCQPLGRLAAAGRERSTSAL